MLEFLDQIDKQLLIFFNSLHTGTFDFIMLKATDEFMWLPFFAIIIYSLFKNYGKEAFWMLISIALIITFADQFISGVMKPFFGRLRPSHEPELQGIIHIVDGYRGGLYGFASSHAGNSFGIATFLWLVTKERIPWMWVMFVWAAIFTYTRIYLGVHYPFDVIVGGLIGVIIGLIIRRVYIAGMNRVTSQNQ